MFRKTLHLIFFNYINCFSSSWKHPGVRSGRQPQPDPTKSRTTLDPTRTGPTARRCSPTRSSISSRLPAIPGTGAEATATVDPKTGGISAITVTSPGSGYIVAPTVDDHRPGMTPTALASATAAISLGVITSITVDEAGFGFTAPVVTITGGNPTSGLEATAIASGGVDNVHADRWRKRLHHPADRRILAPQPARRRAGHRVSDHGRERRRQQRHRSEPWLRLHLCSDRHDLGRNVNPGGRNASHGSATIGIGQIDVTSGGQGYDSAPIVTITDTVGTPTRAPAPPRQSPSKAPSPASPSPAPAPAISRPV